MDFVCKLQVQVQIIFGLALFAVFIDSANSLSLRNIHNMEILDVEKIAQGIRSKQPDTSAWLWLAQHKVAEYLHNIEVTKGKGGGLTPASKLVHSFKWNKCDQGPSLMNLTDLSVGPDPVDIPGDLSIQFAATLKETVDAPLKLKMILKKKITPTFWLDVPCIKGIGSCTYDDMCDILQGATCPKPLVKYDIPCKCPFPKGPYKMLKSTFNIAGVAEVPGGDYSVEVNTSFGQQHVACIELHFSIKKD